MPEQTVWGSERDQTTMSRGISVGDLLKGQNPPACIDENESVQCATVSMTASGGEAIVVTKGGYLSGVFTERDLALRVVAAELDPTTTPLRQVLPRGSVTLHPDDTHMQALRLMSTADCRYLPVVQSGGVLGLVSRRQLLDIDVVVLE
jgi:CBS domain-containing protein